MTEPIQAFPRGPDYPGMSLRDYFAAQVLMGWFAGFEAGQPYRDVDEEANARLAYRQADAMLAERAK